MIEERWRMIFWGLLLILLDLRASGLDLVPDPLGYLLIALNLGQLAALDQAFARARIFATVLIAVSLVDLLGIGNIPGLDLQLWLSSVWLLSAVFDGLLVWFLCTGIATLAQLCRNRSLADNAERVRGAYAIAACGTILLLPTPLRDAALLPLAVCTLAVMVLLIALVRRAGAELKEKGF